MKKRKLEDILEECIDSGLHGRRTVEQSLALYPDHAAELEPLLRTALRVQWTYRSFSPSPALQQRGLNRFLTAAADKRNVRYLTRGIGRRSWVPGFFRNPLFGGVAAAAAVLVLTVALAGTMLSGGDDPGSNGGFVVDPITPTEAPESPTLASLAAQIESIKQRAENGQRPSGDDLTDINELFVSLTNDFTASGTIPPGGQEAVNNAIAEIEQLIEDDPDLADDPEVQETLDGGYNLASLWGPPAVTDAPTVVPATDVPTSPPTVAPTKTPVPATPTPAPTPAPTQAPTPTEDSRPPDVIG